MSTTAFNNANGGHVDFIVDSGGTINFDRTAINSEISGTGTFNTSGVNVQAPNGTVTLSNNSRISTSTSSMTSSAFGNPITVNAQTISLIDSSSLNATTSGVGAGGNISLQNNDPNNPTTSINPATSVEISRGSLITADALNGASAKGGNISIRTGTFTLSQGGRVQARTLGQGQAGDVALTFTDTATISGLDNSAYSGILTDTQGTGVGGKITINKPTEQVGALTLSDGGFLSARTTGSANSGNIEVNINNLDLVTGGRIITTSSGSGKAGNITINPSGNVSISGQRNPLTDQPSTFNNGSINPTPLNPQNATPLDPNIDQSGVNGIPYVTVPRVLGGSTTPADYYSFTVPEGRRGIFDIDNAPANVVDTQLFLYDRQTGQLLAFNDDSYPVDPGSTSRLEIK